MLQNQISEKEQHLILEYINLFDDKLVWAGHPKRQDVPTIGFFFGATIVSLCALVGFFAYWIMITTGIFDYTYLIEESGVLNVSVWLLSLVTIYTYFYYTRNNKTMIYGITSCKVFWLSKGWKVTLHELYFDDIAKIDLVGRIDDPTLFTIYYTPSKRLNFYGYNYEKRTTRPFPTFETVENGDQVYSLLEEVLRNFQLSKVQNNITLH